jgi:hypothetical protein
MNITIASHTFEIDDGLLSTETRAHLEPFISLEKPPTGIGQFRIVQGAKDPLIQSHKITNRLNCVGYVEKNRGVIISTNQFVVNIDFENYLIEVTPLAEWVNDTYAGYKALKLLVSIICVQYKSILLHSSIVFKNNEALVFTGDSGAGKSTILRLLCTSFQVLNEEYNILSIKGGQVIGHSTPFGRIKGKNHAHPVVSRIFFLKQSTCNKIVQCTESNLYLKLIRNICTFPSTDALASKLLDTIIKISETVSINDLYFTKSKSIVNMFN